MISVMRKSIKLFLGYILKLLTQFKYEKVKLLLRFFLYYLTIKKQDPGIYRDLEFFFCFSPFV